MPRAAGGGHVAGVGLYLNCVLGFLVGSGLSWLTVKYVGKPPMLGVVGVSTTEHLQSRAR